MKLAVLLALSVLSTVIGTASNLLVIPDVRRAQMTGETLPPSWSPIPGGLPGFDRELAALRRPGAARSLPLLLRVDASSVPTPEGYRLIIRRGGIRITGADKAGVFYGLKTLRQLVGLYPKGAPCGVIDDAPAFRIRGFMHDTGRNFQTVAMLKAQLDRFADYKLNVFHWHLTDRPGWRIESRAYPILDDPRTRMAERDPNSTYSYQDIREVIAYAKARYIRVIPELDMPGHSDYFKKAFGFEMGDPRALPILKALIDEFCEEIPASDCPILHIGSDEVRISRPKEFVAAIIAEVRQHGRIPMMWNPGLPNDGSAIEQVWREQGADRIPLGPSAGVVDSGLGYLNNYDPAEIVRRYFFQQSCGVAKGNANHLGGILCCWPDIRVVDKAKIPLQNGVWPAVLTFAQNTWTGRSMSAPSAANALPGPNTARGREYAAFETRLARHRDTFFAKIAFPFVKSSGIVWRTIGPFSTDTPESETPKAAISASYGQLSWKVEYGGVIPVDFMVPPAPGKTGWTPGVAYALTYIHSKTATTLRAQVGFDTPSRSDRYYGGIPAAGTWDANGGAIFLNDEIAPPPAWKAPGTRRLMSHSWANAFELIPIEDEELYWTREPAGFKLRAGWNKVLVKIPAGYSNHKPKFAFFPVRRDASGRWVEDSRVRFAVAPN